MIKILKKLDKPSYNWSHAEPRQMKPEQTNNSTIVLEGRKIMFFKKSLRTRIYDSTSVVRN